MHNNHVLTEGLINSRIQNETFFSGCWRQPHPLPAIAREARKKDRLMTNETCGKDISLNISLFAVTQDIALETATVWQLASYYWLSSRNS